MKKDIIEDLKKAIYQMKIQISEKEKELDDLLEQAGIINTDEEY